MKKKNQHSLRRTFGAALLAGAGFALPVTSVHAGTIEDLLGRTLNTVQPLLTALTDPFIDPLVGVVEFSDPLKRTLVRINGRYLDLAPNTAAFEVEVSHNGLDRRFLVITPADAPTGAPVLLMLHGAGGTAENQANMSEVSDLVAAEGVWAVLPDALYGRWEDPTQPTGADDIGFLRRVIDFAVGEFELDASRVYATGLSAGAFMTTQVGCALADQVAATAVVAGAITRQLSLNCDPQPTPRPIMFIAGTTDLIVPYNGGRFGVLSLPDTFDFYLGLHQCNPASTTVEELPVVVQDGTSVTLSRNDDCAVPEVRLYTVEGGGHAWPGGWQYLPVPIIGRTSGNLDATTEMWAFFSGYQL